MKNARPSEEKASAHDKANFNTVAILVWSNAPGLMPLMQFAAAALMGGCANG